MRIGMRKIVAAMLAGAALCSGCAPQFIEIQRAEESKAWVQRPATIISDQLAPTPTQEFVLAKPGLTIDSEERVRWISGVDLAKSRFQRSHQRLAPMEFDLNRSGKNHDSLVDIHKFEIVESRLSVASQLQVEKFSATANGRYYVEFLNKGPMSESGVKGMTEAWQALSGKLKAKGLNTSSVVMGGSKYDQSINAIVLVKVGK